MSHLQSIHTPTTSRFVNVGTSERLISIMGGSLLAFLALRRHGLARVLYGTGGVALLWRGLSGYSLFNQMIGRDTAVRGARSTIDVTESLTVHRPRHEVYLAWRRLEDLPRFMRHLEAVRELDNDRSHWIARLPRDARVIEWEARIIVDEENELLAWRSEPGAVVDNAGEILFRDAPAGRGTEVIARISYRPAVGRAGRAAARTLNPQFARLVREDMRRFKHMLEAGDIPRSEAQPAGRAPAHS